MMLAVTRATGSYAAAGTLMALFGVASVLLSPARAALIDRYGARRALVPMVCLYAALLTLLAAVTWRPGVPLVVLGAVIVAAGACTPPLGPTMRAVWSDLLKDQELLRRAYSLDGVAEEVLFVSGPLIVGALIQAMPPAAGVALSAVLVAVGGAAFLASPAVARLRPAAGEGGEADGKRRTRGVRAIAQPMAVTAGVGLALGGLDLLVMAFADQQHHGDGVVAWVLAAVSAGSAVGGLLNGALAGIPVRVRLSLSATALGLVLAIAGLAPGLGVFTVVAACAGFFIAPALTTAYLVADEAAPPGFRTQAGAWVNTAVNGGMSAGAAAAGALVAHLPLGLCFAVSGAVALASVGLGLCLGPAGEVRARLPLPEGGRS
jgi:MFS family permease